MFLFKKMNIMKNLNQEKKGHFRTEIVSQVQPDVDSDPFIALRMSNSNQRRLQNRANLFIFMRKYVTLSIEPINAKECAVHVHKKAYAQ